MFSVASKMVIAFVTTSKKHGSSGDNSRHREECMNRRELFAKGALAAVGTLAPGVALSPAVAAGGPKRTFVLFMEHGTRPRTGTK
jgi:hypothetical protein